VVDGPPPAITIHGLQHTLDRVESLMGLYGWKEWPNFFPFYSIAVPEQPMASVLSSEEFCNYIRTGGSILSDHRYCGLSSLPRTKSSLIPAITELARKKIQLASGADILCMNRPGHWARDILPPHRPDQAPRKAEVGPVVPDPLPRPDSSPRNPVAGSTPAVRKGPVTLAEDTCAGFRSLAPVERWLFLPSLYELLHSEFSSSGAQKI